MLASEKFADGLNEKARTCMFGEVGIGYRMS